MKNVAEFVLSRIGFGLLFTAPIYLSILLLLKAFNSLSSLLQPIKRLFPDWLQAESLLALLILVGIIFVVGVLVQTTPGQRVRKIIERSMFQRIPGYSIYRSVTKRISGDTLESDWKPALVETDDAALMPVFIVEELPDGRYTVFVPSVPTPFAGAVFIYPRERVHQVNVPFSQALKVALSWGEGTKELVAAMEQNKLQP